MNRGVAELDKFDYEKAFQSQNSVKILHAIFVLYHKQDERGKTMSYRTNF